MKRSMKIAALCSAAVFMFVSCNKIQETNVDFGSKTFINEYKDITDAINGLRDAMTNQTTSLENKLVAIEDAIKNQTLETRASDEFIKLAIEALDSSVKAGVLSEQQALNQIQAAITSQTTGMDTKLAAIEAAIGAQMLTLEQGLTAVRTAIESNGTKLSDVITALNSIKTRMENMEKTQADGYRDIVDMLEKVAYDNGIYIPDGTTDKTDSNYNPAFDPTYNVYVNPLKWKNLKQAYDSEPDKMNPVTEDGKTYKEITEGLVEYAAAIYPVQAAYNNDGETRYYDGLHPHAFITQVSEADPVVIGSDVIVGDSEYVRVVKAAGDITCSVNIDTGLCGCPEIFEVEVFDAEAQLKYDLGQTSGITVHDFKQVNDEWTEYYVDGDSDQHPFRVDWTGDQYGSVNGIRLKTYYRDATTGKTLIADRIYLTVKADDWY